MLFHELVAKGYERPDIAGVATNDWVWRNNACPISAAYYAVHQDQRVINDDIIKYWFRDASGASAGDISYAFDNYFYGLLPTVEEAVEWCRTNYPDLEIEP